MCSIAFRASIWTVVWWKLLGSEDATIAHHSLKCLGSIGSENGIAVKQRSDDVFVGSPLVYKLREVSARFNHAGFAVFIM